MSENSQPQDMQTTSVAQIFQFTGSAKEYFAIWISNLFLSFITLGIYSAWAKVRRLRYLYGHLRIAGHPLHYHADGMMIFKGRMVTFAVFIVYSAVSQYAPLFGLLIFAGLIIVSPWIVHVSLSFRTRMLSWRNIHFRWHGSAKGVFITVLPIFLFVFLSSALNVFLNPLEAEKEVFFDSYNTFAQLNLLLGIAFLIVYPYVLYLWTQYMINHISWGGLRFNVSITLKKVVLRTVFALYAPFLLAVLLAGMILFYITGAIANDVDVSSRAQESVFFMVMMIISVFFMLYIGLAIFKLYFRDLVVNSSSIQEGDEGTENTETTIANFYSRITWFSSAWLIISNVVVSVVSLGLLYPWTVIRKEKFLADRTAVSFHDDLEKIVDKQQESISSIASELADYQDWDISPW